MIRPFPARVRAALLLLLVGAAGCPPPSPRVIGPAGDPEGTAARLREQTTLEEPLRIVFAWRLNDGGQRVEGRGVARVEPPYRARLDLFLDNGESVVSAALVDGELRLPPGSADDILPPPDLMWGALGVFRPRPEASLLGADRLEGEGLRLRYDYGSGREVHFRVMEGVLSALELIEGGRVVQRVDVDPEREARYPVEATYRNLAEFRELRITRESLDVVSPFDPEIWDLAE